MALGERPEVRYAKSEGGAVAYQAVGNESLDLVFLPEWMNNLEMQWDDPRVARGFRHASRCSAVCSC
jgi:hypothetical protein